MTKIQRASIYLFLLFAGIGLEFELGHLSQQEFSQSAGRDLVLNLSVLAAIIIPLYLFSKRLAKQLSVPTYLLWPESLVCQQPCTPFRSVAYTGDDERIVLFFGSDRGPSAAGGVGRTRGKMVEVFKRDRQPGPVRRQGFGRNQQGS